ncbi:MAG TPA: ABC transporter ATP-binding protein, partial [Egibacteraceae bacterium]|nr:ABC transporter ATP-binding protein [Egibacteraceae bacterium]
MSAGPLLEVEGLSVSYRVTGGAFEALHDISFALDVGQVLGVVGESGCGKSTLSAAMMRLLPPNGRITAGRMTLDGDDLRAMDDAALRRLRGRRIGMVFQDPLTSLNPTFRVSTQMVNAQRAHGLDGSNGGHSLRQRAVDMLERVGIPDAADRVDDYPHEFSGGMRQRIMIATSLLLEPQLLICDEATSALDVTLQAQILELLRELGREHNTAIMFISHDLGVISEICKHMLVLYAGRVVECGDVASVLRSPAHPYTRKLLDAVPSRHRRDQPLSTIRGRVPSLAALPPGCKFAPRCDYCQPVCDEGEPAMLPAESQQARCLIYAPDSAYD